ncbi:MAG: 50S ribosomal protein L9 [Holosporaceae bacterium]|jgi:large subunit ribosomal protein L9|nr:50S ribosomal protein L9 [Holosporaceae bacterium]
MERINVILLRRVAKLGQIGDVIPVRPGFARNYLLPQKIALRATKENIKYFEDRKAQIEATNAETRAEAQKVAEEMKECAIAIIRQASEHGILYGSVSGRDIAAAIKAKGFVVAANQINLNIPIKTLGVHDIPIDLHPEVSIMIKLSVAKSEEEAQQQISEII